MHIFSSLLNITLQVSDGLSIHRQEFKTVHTASGICCTGSLTACQRANAPCHAVNEPVRNIPDAVCTVLNS